MEFKDNFKDNLGDNLGDNFGDNFGENLVTTREDLRSQNSLRSGTAVFSDLWTMGPPRKNFRLILAYNMFKS